MTSFEDIWIKFFSDAGLPGDISATYAVTFTENRIRMNMLLDLNKEYLREMGIVCMGDVIAILRHAKKVHNETARNRILASSSNPISDIKHPAHPEFLSQEEGNHNFMTDISKSINVSKHNFKRKITPPDASKVKIEPLNTAKFQKNSTNDHNVHDIKNTSSFDEKAASSNVFNRLGNNNEILLRTTKMVNEKKKLVSNSQKDISNTVFSRLGEKEIDYPGQESYIESFKPKSANLPPKKIIIETNGSARTLSKIPPARTMQADKIPINFHQKLSDMSSQRKSVKFSPHVDCKLIEKCIPSSAPSLPSNMVVNNVKLMQNRDVKKTALNSINKNNIKARLGKTVLNKDNTNVFKRLGIQTKSHVSHRSFGLPEDFNRQMENNMRKIKFGLLK